ncbi:hypothetical protein BJV74DRAFT_798232 [Russula compacta]|nr:hypothetical protein BJV74DRAFT_798232 [Russula compacta]
MAITPYAHETPSQAAWTSCLHEYQRDPQKRIMDDRPKSGVQITPIALLSLTSFVNVPRRRMVWTLRDSNAPVNHFANVMCPYYDQEDLRRDEVIWALNEAFVYNKLLFPALGLTIVGSFIGFRALILFSRQGQTRKTHSASLDPLHSW